MKSNQKAWQLWNLADTQWRVTAFSIIGLDYPAVFQIADLYGIEVTPAIHQKLRILEVEELKNQSEGGESDEQRSTNSNISKRRGQ